MAARMINVTMYNNVRGNFLRLFLSLTSPSALRRNDDDGADDENLADDDRVVRRCMID